MSMRVKETENYTNSDHPECRPGEVWITNCARSSPDDFEEIGYQTKRPGQVAYDINGKEVPSHFPVFVWKGEYNSRHPEVKIGQ